MKKAAREQGDGAVINGNAGRHPANATGEGSRDRIIAFFIITPFRLTASGQKTHRVFVQRKDRL
ncbi:MAG: hypothetical protein LBB22_00495 [Treponema sp.]|nr:hypothetical protein [Treponema sp.]